MTETTETVTICTPDCAASWHPHGPVPHDGGRYPVTRCGECGRENEPQSPA